METYKIPCSEAMKRLWRRRRYQRLPNGIGGRRRLKIAKLGGVGDGRTTTTMASTRLQLKIWALFSPLRLLARFHDAYVEMMMGKSVGVSRRKIVARKRACMEETQVAVAFIGEEIDQRLVL